MLATVLVVSVDASGESLAELRRAFEREVTRARGHVLPGDGTSLVARFEGPGRAVQCGATAVRLARESGARAGVHIGECERDAKDGPVFEVAAALAASAAVHEVRVSRTVVDLVPGSGIAFAERGAIDLKSGSWPVWSVAETEPR